MMDSYEKPDFSGGIGEEPAPESSELGDALSMAFPDQDWSPERVSAFKEAMSICMAPESEEPMDDEDEGPSSKGPGKNVLALMFGKKK